MLTMRSISSKVTKPPPPVPPRPSKNVVAEALAKSRTSHPLLKQYNRIVVPKFVDAEQQQQQHLKPKPATRTLIYQSANAKPSSIEEIRVNVNRKESIKRDCDYKAHVTRTSSFKSAPPPPPPPQLIETTIVPQTPPPPQLHQLKAVDDRRDSSLESLGESAPVSRSNSFRAENERANNNNSSDSVISDDDDDGDYETDRNHVNTLIDEMFASVLDVPPEQPVSSSAAATTMILVDDVKAPAPPHDKVTIRTGYKDDDSQLCANNLANNNRHQNNGEDKTIVVIAENRKRIDDKLNHELLISELSSMKRERLASRRQRQPSSSESSSPSSESKIQTSDWVEAVDGKEIRLSSCQITIEDGNDIISRLEMANLHGLPPLPKSLSGFNIDGPPTPYSSLGRTPSQRAKAAAAAAANGEVGSLKKGNNLDAKLALLRREMYSLRQLDLSLLSQLWSLNESIQDFRSMLQEQDDRNVLSPPSPSPTTSSGEDVDGDDYFQPSPMRFRLAPPPPPPHRRTSNSSSGTGSSV